MNNQEILEKAIRKAVDGGWKDGLAIGVYSLEKNKRGTYGLRSVSDGWINVEAIIFNHQFAKALWGDKKHERLTAMMPWRRGAVGSPFFFELSLWQYQLQQMVIADDPLEYLKENI